MMCSCLCIKFPLTTDAWMDKTENRRVVCALKYLTVPARNDWTVLIFFIESLRASAQ